MFPENLNQRKIFTCYLSNETYEAKLIFVQLNFHKNFLFPVANAFIVELSCMAINTITAMNFEYVIENPRSFKRNFCCLQQRASLRKVYGY